MCCLTFQLTEMWEIEVYLSHEIVYNVQLIDEKAPHGLNLHSPFTSTPGAIPYPPQVWVKELPQCKK